MSSNVKKSPLRIKESTLHNTTFPRSYPSTIRLYFHSPSSFSPPFTRRFTRFHKRFSQKRQIRNSGVHSTLTCTPFSTMLCRDLSRCIPVAFAALRGSTTRFIEGSRIPTPCYLSFSPYRLAFVPHLSRGLAFLHLRLSFTSSERVE